MGGKQQNKPTKTYSDTTSISARRGESAIKDGETTTGLPHQRPSSAQARRTPRPSRSRQETRRARRKSELARVHRLALPRRGLALAVRFRFSPALAREHARRLNIRDGNAHFRWRLFPSPLRPRLWLSVRQRHLASRVPPAAEGLASSPPNLPETPRPRVGFTHSARRAGPQTPPLTSSRAGRVLRLLRTETVGVPMWNGPQAAGSRLFPVISSPRNTVPVSFCSALWFLISGPQPVFFGSL
ncbi:hypothetical protein NN561_012800 [Cricetulus griseus]